MMFKFILLLYYVFYEIISQYHHRSRFTVDPFVFYKTDFLLTISHHVSNRGD